MKVLATAAALLMATVASANPFAPKVTQNTAKAGYLGNLMRAAKPTENSQLRRLEDEVEVDITSYSIKFEKCQFVKQYGGGQGNNNNNNNNKNNAAVDTILSTQRFVIFRLCPNNSCSSCNYEYGEYIVDMETYLQTTLEFKQQQQEQYCQNCEACANNNADGDGNANDDAAAANNQAAANVNCDTCYDECQNIENMEENGYADAAEYTECQMVYDNESDDNRKVYYAGPMCTSSGTRIKIGLFLDEDCSTLDSSAEIDQYLKNNDGYNIKLSYHLLKQVFPEEDCVASCTKEDENQNDDANANVEISEVCQTLYEASGKCEQSHGMTDGIAKYQYNDNYGNQILQEEQVCEYISKLESGQYDQTGEIVISGGRSVAAGGAQTTGGQKFALTFFIIGTVGLAAYAAMLHQQLTKGAKADLSAEGGAMA